MFGFGVDGGVEGVEGRVKEGVDGGVDRGRRSRVGGRGGLLGVGVGLWARVHW